jgi:hypothetical protein
MAKNLKWTAENSCASKARDMLEQSTHRPFQWVSYDPKSTKDGVFVPHALRQTP